MQSFDGRHRMDRDFARIVERHAARVRRVLRRRGVAERDLADAEQEVFLVAYRKLAEFEGRSSLGTWLHRIAINVASEQRRRARHRYEALAAAPELEARGADPHAALDARDGLARVSAALGALSPEQRDALLLHDVAGLSTNELARRLGVPLKTAFSRLYAARRALIRALQRRGVAVRALGSWLPWRRSRPDPEALAPHAAHSVTMPGTALTIALACSLLLPSSPGTPVRSSASARNESLRRQVAAGIELPARAMAESGVQVAPHADRREPAPLAPAARGRVRRGGSAARARDAAPPPSAREIAIAFDVPRGAHELDDLTVMRAGARDVSPRVPHPWSDRLYVSAPPRIRVRSASEDPRSLEARLEAATLP
jgi:RNA polymerase sigma-70 factor, ECF subfamily